MVNIVLADLETPNLEKVVSNQKKYFDYTVVFPSYQVFWNQFKNPKFQDVLDLCIKIKKLIIQILQKMPSFFIIILPEHHPNVKVKITNLETLHIFLCFKLLQVKNYLQKKNCKICCLSSPESQKETRFLKLFNYANQPLDKSRLNDLGIRIGKLIQNNEEAKLKAIAFDCDNTIWQGELADFGVNGIKISNSDESKIFLETQKILKQAGKDGYFLVVLSKNDLKNVLNVFRKRHEMILKPEDISYWGVNWLDKSSNLKNAAKVLNISEASFLFIDDSLLEREKMKRERKNVVVFPFPDDLDNFPKKIGNFLNLQKISSEELEKKKKILKLQDQIPLSDSQTKNEAFSKKYQINSAPLNETNLYRAAELCNKTNQFNLTKNRTSMSEIYKIAKTQKNLARVYSLKSKTENFGEIGFLLADRRSKQPIKEFLLSCRVFNLGIENKMANDLKKWMKNNKFNLYLKSKKILSTQSIEFIKKKIND